MCGHAGSIKLVYEVIYVTTSSTSGAFVVCFGRYRLAVSAGGLSSASAVFRRTSTANYAASVAPKVTRIKRCTVGPAICQGVSGSGGPDYGSHRLFSLVCNAWSPANSSLTS